MADATKTPSVFGPATGRQGLVYFTGRPIPESHLAFGYFLAAESLFEQYRHGAPELDIVVFPLCLLLRHGLELTLEDAIRCLWKYYGRETKRGRRKIEGTHSLGDLLERLEREMKEVGEEPVSEEYRTTIFEFDAIDPDGQHFRYAKPKSGESRLTSGADAPFTFDMNAIFAAAKAAHNYFGVLDDVRRDGDRGRGNGGSQKM